MPSNAVWTGPDSRLIWSIRWRARYLMYVRDDTIYNMNVAKVYYQGGQVLTSIRSVPNVVSLETVRQLCEEQKVLLEASIAAHVAQQLDEANSL